MRLFSGCWRNLVEPAHDCADLFVDNVIIVSADSSMSYNVLLEAHERAVTRVRNLLVPHKLTGSSDKATIAVRQVVFAGDVVGNGQRKGIPGKVAGMEHWEKPKTVTELPAWLGFLQILPGVHEDVCRVCSHHDGHCQGQPGGDQEGVQEGADLG